MVKQVNGPRKPAMRVEHDRTVPPMGVMVAAQIQQADDGHHELFAEYDVFPDPVPVALPDGTEAFEQHIAVLEGFKMEAVEALMDAEAYEQFCSKL